ncbi:ribonuclease H-like domain-containing protein [Xylariaceae sp. FL0016]|nr:ribonuclease H-like domain-containing protein [Xylariaceae sp. FL0016]
MPSQQKFWTGVDTVNFIDSPQQACWMIDMISPAAIRENRCRLRRSESQPNLYIDVEGIALGRSGPISLLTLLHYNQNMEKHVYIVDIHKLGSAAFTTRGSGFWSKNLKYILESHSIPKAFFDVRNDSDALYAQFGIPLAGIHDIQLMESATQETAEDRKFLAGLNKCIKPVDMKSELNNTPNQYWIAWRRAKRMGKELFDPEKGGGYSIFSQRPLPPPILWYCVGDVQYLPELWKRYQGDLASDYRYRLRRLVLKASARRVEDSQKSTYQSHGRNRALSEWTAEENLVLDSYHGKHRAKNPDNDTYSTVRTEDTLWYYKQQAAGRFLMATTAAAVLVLLFLQFKRKRTQQHEEYPEQQESRTTTTNG